MFAGAIVLRYIFATTNPCGFHAAAYKLCTFDGRQSVAGDIY
jgi:hypothetical protein